MTKALLITAYPNVGSKIIEQRIGGYRDEVVEVGISGLRELLENGLSKSGFNEIYVSGMYHFFCAEVYHWLCKYKRKHKQEDLPPTILGGAAPTMNPNPYLEMFDNIALGECDFMEMDLPVSTPNPFHENRNGKESKSESEKDRTRIVKFTAPGKHLSKPVVVTKYGNSKIGRMEKEIEVTRGCKHRCHFCPIPRIYQHKEQHVGTVIDAIAQAPDAYWNFVSADIFGYSGFPEIVDFCYDNKIKIRGTE